MDEMWFMLIILGTAGVLVCGLAAPVLNIKINPVLKAISALCILFVFIIGLFALLAMTQGSTMQPVKAPKYEQVKEPIYRQVAN